MGNFSRSTGAKAAHLLVEPEKPIQWLRVFILGEGLRGSVIVHEVACFEV